MSQLYSFVKKTTAHLGNISFRNIYGLDAIFVRDKAFILISKEGRVVIRIEDLNLIKSINTTIKLEEFSLNGKVLQHWLMIPEPFNKKKNKIIPLIDSAYASLFKKSKNKKIKRKKKPVTVEPIINSKEAEQLKGSDSIFAKVIAFFKSKF